MEELDLLKKAWKKDEHSFNQVSEKEIYKMLHKKSSSIVKWILIISILEFLLWTALSLCFKDGDAMKKFNNMHVDNIMLPLTIFGYVVLVYFFYQFYSNYKKISVTDDAKKLIKSILKVRKTVNRYVWFNIIFGMVSIVIITLLQLNYDADTIALRARYSLNGNSTTFYIFYTVFIVVFLAIFVSLFWLFYRLIYGILLRKLHKNHEELKKIDL
ncbi:MAG: hypothetical protein PSV16_03255 [Flavobacterium sp.]|nr:hypothetical protein [Flavobacterium sp.]